MTERDTELLSFIYQRLVDLYGEKPNTDYMKRLGELAGVNRIVHSDYKVQMTLQQLKGVEETLQRALKERLSMNFLGGVHDLDFVETRDIIGNGFVKHTCKFTENTIFVLYSKLSDKLDVLITIAVDISDEHLLHDVLQN